MKKLLSLVLSLTMLLSLLLPVRAENATRIFTDSLGREIAVPADITRIAVTGSLGRVTLFAIAPDLLVGIPEPWDDAAKAFIPAEYHNLPNLGQVYGGKGEMNLEELLAADPQVVIDIGEPKDGVAEDLDALME